MVRKIGLQRSGAFLFALGPLIVSSVSLAQDIPQAPAAAPAGEGSGTSSESDQPVLEEITVTAQRRLERLQDVPVSVEVVNRDAIVQQNLNTLTSLADTVPSVHIVTNAGGASQLYIRGIGSGINQGFDQSAGMFIDDIYHGRSRMSSAAFLDLNRVEVLKGPQTTFFGNNAIAGAFNIVTEKPRNTFDAWTRALYGEYGQYALEGALGGPLTESIAVRAAATFNGSNGWIENINTGDDQPEENNVAGRLSFLFQPNDRLDATLKIEDGRNRNNSGLFLTVANCPPPAPFVAAGFCNTALAAGVPTGADSDRNAESPNQKSDLDTFESVLTVNYQAGGHSFTSVSGFYDYDYLQNLDTDATPSALLHVQLPERYHQFSQELRMTSPTGGKFEYLGGIYYQKSRLAAPTDFSYFFLSGRLGGTPLAPYLPLGQHIDFTQDENSYAVFGSVSWNATERLKLSTGLRSSWVEKRYDHNLFYGTASQDFGGIVPLPDAIATFPAALGLGTTGPLSGSRNDNALMPSAKIQYQVGPDAMAYVSYARGFKGGGFNAIDNSGAAANLPFEPEYVNAYELGLKSEWFARRLLLNLAVFQSDYTDLQVSTNNLNAAGTYVSLVKNAAESRSRGIELETRWAASEHLRLSANATYLDSKYLNYRNVALTQRQQLQYNQCLAQNPLPNTTCQPLGKQDLSGRPTQFAPKWTGNLTGAYSIPLLGRYQLTTELSAYFSSSSYLHPTLDEDMRQDDYVRLDGRLTFGPGDGRWAIDVIGKNLTDKTILAFITTQPTALGSNILQREQPRNVAAQFRYRW